ncbi:MAG: SIS domain-containing protein, partial [Gammaproteobacteria bacterium]|nr:SIS domain-containing protein [Gammaproteobacteria bacterium]
MGKSLIDIAKEVIQTEAESVEALKERIDQNFIDVCLTLKSCMGKVVLIGMGKSGHIAKKISSTLASTGTPAFYLHPGEAGHGDLGMVSHDDVVIMISYSGESDEIIALLPG